MGWQSGRKHHYSGTPVNFYLCVQAVTEMNVGSQFITNCSNLSTEDLIPINLSFSGTGTECCFISSVIVLVLTICKAYQSVLQRLLIFSIYGDNSYQRAVCYYESLNIQLYMLRHKITHDSDVNCIHHVQKLNYSICHECTFTTVAIYVFMINVQTERIS